MVSTKALICRAQAGDEGAFTELMRVNYAFVYAIVIGIVNNSNDAEEVVQDTFLNAYRGMEQYEDREKFKNWLAEIARNSARDWLRKQRINTVSIDEVSEDTLPTPDSPDEQLIRDEQRELIRRAIGTLAQKDREIARAYYLEGASYDELIRTHGLSYKAISFRLSRAKQKLAKRLGHLLTGAFVSPITSLKQIYSGGLTVMKVGTVPKITAGVVAIIILAFIGTRQFISSKEDTSPSVEVVTSTPSETANSVTQTDTARKDAVTAPLREDKPQISAEEMGQIEDLFAQLDEADGKSEVSTSQFLTDTEVAQNTDEHVTTDTDAFAEHIEQSAEEVMNAFVEAMRNLEQDTLLSLMTVDFSERVANAPLFPSGGEIREILKDAADEMPDDIKERLLKAVAENEVHIEFEALTEIEVVSYEYVGDEFRFRLRCAPPDISEILGTKMELLALPDALVKMRKENGAWRIYEMH